MNIRLIVTSIVLSMLCQFSASAQVIDCVCSSAYSVGDRVQLTQDMDDSSGLLAGAVGTVLCGSASGNLYVSWDAWAGGHNSNGSCACESGDDDPDNSHWYVSCSKVVAYMPIDCACASQYSVGDRVELAEDLNDESGLMAGSLGTVVCARPTDRVLVDWDDLGTGHDGNGICVCGAEGGSGFSNWFVDCDKIGPASVIECACDSEYSVGDRVTLLADNPDGASNLPAGSAGTVLCGDGGATYDLYVSWDSWSDGHNETAYCDCQSGAGDLDNSHWLVQCGQVRHGEPGTIEVPGDYATIQGAIDVSIDGETIQVAAGTYYEYAIDTSGRAVTISGAVDADGEPTTIVDADSMGRGFYFYTGETSATVLQNLVIRDGIAATDGAGVYISNAHPRFSNCHFENNDAAGSGGGVYMTNSATRFTNCTFRSNTAANGGGVYVYSSYNALFDGCQFDFNEAVYSGGGFYAMTSTYFQLWDSTFTGNSAGEGGGGMTVYEPSYSAVIHDTEFINNVASYGAGLYGYYAYFNMEGNVFRDNVANGYGAGGGAYLVECAGSIRSSQLVGNSGEYGAGMYVYGDWGTSVTGTSFEGNVAEVHGGGLITYHTNDPLSLSECTFMGNQAELGGGMYSHWSDSGLSSCTFNGNLATVDGGGLYGYAGTSTLTNCTFRGNSAIASDFSVCRGGGICNAYQDSTMVGCTIEDNTSGSGGGIYNEGSDPVLEDCTVSSNVGKVCGGGMFSEDGVAWMTGTTFCANQPDNIIGAWVDQGDNDLSATCELPPGLCVGDVNADYDVDVLDLLYVIAVWNTDNPAGDINEDGWVDVMDLLEVIGNWGECGDAD